MNKKNVPAVQIFKIEAPHGLALNLGLREIWEYRDLLYFMVWRDLKARYRQTALGPVWIILQPLFSMVLYTVIFGSIANLPSEGKPYAVFTYVALLPWGFFTQAVSGGTNSLLGNINLISKVYFPRLTVPLASLVSNLVDLGISFVILLGLLIYYGITPTWGVIFIPLFLLLAAVSGMAVGLWFSGAVVKYRDFGQISGYLVRAWMFATPVVYSMDLIPERWRTLYQLNPMTGVVIGFRWALLSGSQPPDWTLMGISALLSLALLLSGLYIFRRVERSIVDVA